MENESKVGGGEIPDESEPSSHWGRDAEDERGSGGNINNLCTRLVERDKEVTGRA